MDRGFMAFVWVTNLATGWARTSLSVDHECGHVHGPETGEVLKQERPWRLVRE